MNIENNKIALCCAGYFNHKYIRDYVEYYIKNGADHIFLYELNIEEISKNVLTDYVESNIVTIIKWTNTVEEAYNQCLYDNYLIYDFIMCFDSNEYMAMSPEYEYNFKNYLYNGMFDNVHCILINRLSFTDNNLVQYEEIPVWQRFTEPVQPVEEFTENFYIKSIVNCKLLRTWEITDIIFCSKYVCISNNPNKFLTFATSSGDLIDGQPCNMLNQTFNNNACLCYYPFKTIEEYCDNNIFELMIKYNNTDIDYDDNLFFKYNNYTVEKQKIYDDYIAKNNPYYLNFNKHYNNTTETKFTVVSCVFGDEDNMKFYADFTDENVEYIMITDNHNLKLCHGWNILYSDEIQNLQNLTTIQKTKYVKTHPFEFANTEYAIYMDFSIIIRSSLNEIMNDFILSNNSIGLFFHPERTNILEEYNSWKERDKTIENTNILSLYDNISNYVLYFCSVIFYKNTSGTNCITNMWYNKLLELGFDNEYKCYRSDQLVLPYIIENNILQNNIKQEDIMIFSPTVLSSDYFHRYAKGGIFTTYGASGTLIKYNDKLIKSYNIN